MGIQLIATNGLLGGLVIAAILTINKLDTIIVLLTKIAGG